jgi:hypothetical protein
MLKYYLDELRYQRIKGLPVSIRCSPALRSTGPLGHSNVLIVHPWSPSYAVYSSRLNFSHADLVWRFISLSQVIYCISINISNHVCVSMHWTANKRRHYSCEAVHISLFVQVKPITVCRYIQLSLRNRCYSAEDTSGKFAFVKAGTRKGSSIDAVSSRLQWVVMT